MTTATDHITINRVVKDRDYWDYETWWKDNRQQFRLRLHTDSSYAFQAWAKVEMLTPNGWTDVIAFNPADYGENVNTYGPTPSFKACRQYARDAAEIVADHLR